MRTNRSKYNVDNSKLGKIKRTYNGILFDSQLECNFYANYVVPLLKAGKIENVRMQVRYELLPSFVYKGKKQRKIEYVSDFDITYADGTFKVIDVKGMVKPIDKLKSKLFKYRYPDIDFCFMGYTSKDGWYIK